MFEKDYYFKNYVISFWWSLSDMSGIEIDIDVHRLRKARHCWRGSPSYIWEWSHFRLRPEWLRVASNNSTQSLAIHDTWENRAALALNICSCQSQASRIVWCVMKACSSLKRASCRPLSASRSSYSSRTSLSCLIPYFSWSYSSRTLRSQKPLLNSWLLWAISSNLTASVLWSSSSSCCHDCSWLL